MTIPFNLSAIEEKVTEKVTIKLNLVQKKMLELIQENPNMTIPELMEKLSLSDSGVIKNLNKLKVLGIIKRKGSHRLCYWEIIR